MTWPSKSTPISLKKSGPTSQSPCARSPSMGLPATASSLLSTGAEVLGTRDKAVALHFRHQPRAKPLCGRSSLRNCFRCSRGISVWPAIAFRKPSHLLSPRLLAIHRGNTGSGGKTIRLVTVEPSNILRPEGSRTRPIRELALTLSIMVHAGEHVPEPKHP